VTHKSGRTGDLVLVDVEHRISQSGSERLTERQTLVYRDVGDPTPAVIAVVLPDDSAAELWEPTSIDLFRFSAATFNSHRIHYDLPYASDVEGYPGLVVHGPFTASRLFGLLTRDRAPPRRFCFRALAPLFAGQPIRLVRTATGASAIRVDGVTAMNATAEF
jgi:3-methylfumaryl-CoA hydratase